MCVCILCKNSQCKYEEQVVSIWVLGTDAMYHIEQIFMYAGWSGNMMAFECVRGGRVSL